MAAQPKIMGLLEGVLYVEDLETSVAFYERIFSLDAEVSDATIAVFNVAPGQFLVLFPRSIANEPGRTHSAAGAFDGVLPPHGASGSIHICFAMHTSDVQAWRDKLGGEGVPVEASVRWHRGGTSLYFRDPDQHMLELATRGTWPSY